MELCDFTGIYCWSLIIIYWDNNLFGVFYINKTINQSVKNSYLQLYHFRIFWYRWQLIKWESTNSCYLSWSTPKIIYTYNQKILFIKIELTTWQFLLLFPLSWNSQYLLLNQLLLITRSTLSEKGTKKHPLNSSLEKANLKKKREKRMQT